MTILGIDTATRINSVAVVKDSVVLAEITADEGLTHSSRLANHVELVIQKSKTRLKDLSGIAISIGPGSFTGLRVGVSFAKALAFSSGLPIAGISTLDALALRMNGTSGKIMTAEGVSKTYDELICPALDGKKNEVFFALYAKNGKNLLKLVQETNASAVSASEKILQFAAGTVIFQGDAFAKFGGVFSSAIKGAAEARENIRMPSAVATAVLGSGLISEGLAGSFGELLPMYLRSSDAELGRKNG